MILQHTCIPAGDDYDLSGQIRDVLWFELARGRKNLFEDRSNNAHGFVWKVLEKDGNVTYRLTL